MEFQKLTQTPFGRILLNNAAMAVRCRILTPREQRLALRALSRALQSMPKRYSASRLKRELFSQFQNRAYQFQVAGVETPDRDTYIASVGRFELIKEFLTQIGAVDKNNRRVRSALAPHPSEQALRGAADVINEFSNTMDVLVLKGAHNIFFATAKTVLDDIEGRARRLARHPVNEVRDVLGLCHIHPISPVEPRPVFVFESVRPVAEFSSQFRIARPTTIDGFDNPRFRQEWPTAHDRAKGSGLTVFLKHGFDAGAPEYVATGIALKDNFRCRYLGAVDTMPVGTDLEFIKFLMKDHKTTLLELADELSKALNAGHS